MRISAENNLADEINIYQDFKKCSLNRDVTNLFATGHGGMCTVMVS